MWPHRQVDACNGLEMPAGYVRRKRRQWWGDFVTLVAFGVALAAFTAWRACQ